MDIPVFHYDQHGTAIVAAAGIINAAHLTGRDLKDLKMVVNGAGAASVACTELAKSLGVRHVIMCDSKGVIYQGRTEGMNQWKSAHAADTDARTLADAMDGADLFRSEEHTSELQSLMRSSYAVFCLKKKNTQRMQYAVYTQQAEDKL